MLDGELISGEWAVAPYPRDENSASRPVEIDANRRPSLGRAIMPVNVLVF